MNDYDKAMDAIHELSENLIQQHEIDIREFVRLESVLNDIRDYVLARATAEEMHKRLERNRE